ncbi:hypothetical protein ACLESD_49620, partial [Pyxidicoccus sp. 3LFB2]
MLAQGQQRVVKLGGERVAVWSWGEGPRVLLVHGWSGYGGQLTAFVAPLVEAGFSVVAGTTRRGHGVSVRAPQLAAGDGGTWWRGW